MSIVPLVAPASFFERYDAEQMKLPPRVDRDWDDIPKSGISKNSARSGLLTKLKKQKVLEAYYASVTYMDAQVGKMIRAVDRLGLRDNTIIVFTADHGYHLGEHDFWQKMSLHEESTRIPLIIQVPGKKPSESAALSQQIDIYPTLAELCGLPIPKHVQGKSLVTAIDDPRHVVHDAVYCLRGRNDHLLRTDRWALIRYGRGGVELGTVAVDGVHLGLELRRDVHHEGGLHRVLPIRLGIEDLLGTVVLAVGLVLGQACQITGVPCQLRGEAMVRVAAGGEGDDHGLGA